MHKRTIIESFESWRNNPRRKPMILRGARQVGKTTIIKQFAKEFEQSWLLNLERPEHVALFKEHPNATDLVEAIALQNNGTTEQLRGTLLFIDEIQEYAPAIQLLRYLYEDVPELNVIAAGSLLEFALGEVQSMPVGRIEFRYLYPLDFNEFLGAIGQTQAQAKLNEVPVSSIAHSALLDLYNKFIMVGGMPEVVDAYKDTQSVSSLATIYESIWATYKTDLEKYGANETERRILRHILNVAPAYVDNRITFQNFGNSNYRSREVSDALTALDKAKVIRLLYPTTDKQPPLKPDFKKSPRLQILDTGIVNYSLNLQAELMTAKDLTDAHQGAIVPHMFIQEYIARQELTDHKPNFWVREKKQSQAEVDLVVEYNGLAIPVEIKSGKKGKLRSLHQYIDAAPHPYAVRVYGSKLLIEEAVTPAGTSYILMNLPYYCASKLEAYLAYFLSEYKT